MTNLVPRWRVVIGLAFVLVGVGVLVVDPRILIGAIIPVLVLGYGMVGSTPEITDAIVLRRSVTPAQTHPGGTPTVTLTIENTRDTWITDLRVVDGVPDEVAVIDGSPRATVRLAPGESATLTYTVQARYGTTEFTSTTVRSVGVGALHMQTVTMEPAGDNHITATVTPETTITQRQPTDIVGQQTTDQGGEGIEFHGVRSYQPTDPAHKVNWRQYAKTRELSTIQYRQEEALDTVVAVDLRPCTKQAQRKTAPTGTELCIYMAHQLVSELLANRNRVGMLAFGVQASEIDGPVAGETGYVWIPPSDRTETLTRVQQVLDHAGQAADPSVTEQILSDTVPTATEITERIDGQTQVLFVSPLCDETAVDLVRAYNQVSHTTKIYLPDITSRASTGGLIAQTQHRMRMQQVRQYGVPVISWRPDTESLETALQEGTRRVPAGGGS